VGETYRQFRLPDACRAKKKEARFWSAVPGQAKFAVEEAFRDNRDGIVLSDDDLAQPCRQSLKFLPQDVGWHHDLSPVGFGRQNRRGGGIASP
jgi:hypothetical protein